MLLLLNFWVKLVCANSFKSPKRSGCPVSPPPLDPGSSRGHLQPFPGTSPPHPTSFSQRCWQGWGSLSCELRGLGWGSRLAPVSSPEAVELGSAPLTYCQALAQCPPARLPCPSLDALICCFYGPPPHTGNQSCFQVANPTTSSLPYNSQWLLIECDGFNI